MKNHYKTLGITSSASIEEIRRAYRTLARRYHPDVNPGKATEERFRDIAEAYRVLNDSQLRARYDLELEISKRSQMSAAFRAYQEQAAYRERTSRTNAEASYTQTSRRPSTTASQKKQRGTTSTLRAWSILAAQVLAVIRNKAYSLRKYPALLWKKRTPQHSDRHVRNVRDVSIIEVSLSIHDAIKGLRKTVEIAGEEKPRKVSITIPPGAIDGSIVRSSSRGTPHEEVVLIVRVAPHPFVSLEKKGLIVEMPIDVAEAIEGGRITVPTLDKPAQIIIPKGAQSGMEIRLEGRGIQSQKKRRGDIFYRLSIRVPDAANAVGFVEKANELAAYYEAPVRKSLPYSLWEL